MGVYVRVLACMGVYVRVWACVGVYGRVCARVGVYAETMAHMCPYMPIRTYTRPYALLHAASVNNYVECAFKGSFHSPAIGIARRATRCVADAIMLCC